MPDNIDSNLGSLFFNIILLAIFLLNSSSLVAQEFDFRKLQSTDRSENLSPESITDYKRRIWRYRIQNLQFETGIMNGQHLWVFADGSKLHVTLGAKRQFYPAEFQKNVPGDIIRIDLHSLPTRSSLVLLSISYMSNGELHSELISIQSATIEPNGEFTIRTRYRSNMEVVRPIQDRLYFQEIDNTLNWKPDIFRLKADKSNYQQDQKLSLPENTRLFSLAARPSQGWMYLSSTGDFIITKFGQIKDIVSGSLGTTDRYVSPGVASNSDRVSSEPVRLPPTTISQGRIIAVVDNPISWSGFFSSWFNGQSTNQSLIRLFKFKQDQIIEVGAIGPFDYPILDLEVPETNPDQLLWLRRAGGRPMVLEMIDFSQVNRSLFWD